MTVRGVWTRLELPLLLGFLSCGCALAGLAAWIEKGDILKYFSRLESMDSFILKQLTCQIAYSLSICSNLPFSFSFVFAEQPRGCCNSLVGELEPVALHFGVGELLKVRGQIIVHIWWHIHFSIYHSLGDP
jgi:hypothetical protein